MATTPPIRPSQPSGVDGGTPGDGSSKKTPVSGGFPGSDYLYSAAETTKSSFTGFIWHVLNGADMVVRTVAYVLFYPFLNHYEAEISPEKLKNILTCIKDGTDFSVKFSALETNVRVAVRNKGDTSSAKKIIETFAEAEKAEFEKIASHVIKAQNIDMSAITLTPGSYILSRIQNGQTSVTDFYHALNFYRMESVTPREQFVILEYQVQRSEFLRGEIPHTQKLLGFFADTNKAGFKEVAACLAEVCEDVKAGDGKSLEEVAKEWIEDSGRFEASKMREALDLKAIKAFIEELKNFDSYDEAYELHDFFIKREAKGDKEVSEERRDFMARTLLEKLYTTSPKFTKELFLQMIKIDEENKSIAGLFSEAKEDALWDKPGFTPEKYVLAWIKEEKKFDRNVMINAFLRLEQRVLSEGIVDINKTASVRLGLFDRALMRLPRAQLGAFINIFAKAACNDELGKQVIQNFMLHDEVRSKEPSAVRLIQIAEGADALEATIKVAEEVVKNDDLVPIFRDRLRRGVSSTQVTQFKSDMTDKGMAFASQLESFLLLAKFKLIEEPKDQVVSEVKPKSKDHQFKKDQVVALAETAPKEFAQLAIHMMEESAETKGRPELKRLDQLAKEHKEHPDKVDERNRADHEASNNPFKGKFVPLSEEARTEAKLRAYGQVLMTHFKSSAECTETDLEWLCIGMRSFLTK